MNGSQQDDGMMDGWGGVGPTLQHVRQTSLLAGDNITQRETKDSKSGCGCNPPPSPLPFPVATLYPSSPTHQNEPRLNHPRNACTVATVEHVGGVHPRYCTSSTGRKGGTTKKSLNKKENNKVRGGKTRVLVAYISISRKQRTRVAITG